MLNECCSIERETVIKIITDCFSASDFGEKLTENVFSISLSLLTIETTLSSDIKAPYSCGLLSLSDFTWDAGLKYTKRELEKTKTWIYLIIEKAIRGGISGKMGASYVLFEGKKHKLT